MKKLFSLDELNPVQREIVQAYAGPVLVLAGAGSGKTRVITHRIAFLLHEGIARPWEILAVTFTNKAASEMRQRILKMLGMEQNNDLFIGTFHSFGARLLRRHADLFGRNGNFTIYDADDQNRLVSTILKQMMGSAEAKKLVNPVKRYVEKVKESLSEPESVSAFMPGFDHAAFVDLYKKYERLLKQNNAFDFDDLITLPCKLLRQNIELKNKYRDRFRYLLIDEFQDTDFSQGEIVRLLGASDGNVTAVGDDDQSIYGWRGAHLGNILQFDKDYRDIKVFRLEQNYRSTHAILDVAHIVIKNNQSRHPKKLWTARKGGDKPELIPCNDEREEAFSIIRKIKELTDEGKYNLSDLVILYRTNAQSRPFEDLLRQHVVPYIIVGGLRFYERKEVKDFLAYLRLITNPSDLISVQRIINLPPRGIGQTTLQRLLDYSNSNNITLFDAIFNADKIDLLGGAAANKIKNFGRWIDDIRSMASKESLFKVGERLLKESKLLEYYEKEDDAQAQMRVENLGELLNALREYGYSSENTAIQDLENFLQEVALVTDIDRWNKDEQAVTLMTLHSAKGLEFPVVFLTGLEDGLFPLQNTLDKEHELEEERRLFYVGTTRAMDRLFLSYARNRRRWGQEIPWQRPSRFLDEIPDGLLNSPQKEQFLSERFKRQASLEFSPKSHRAGFTNKPEKDLYPLGARVLHKTFGEGMIINKEGRGEGLRVLVNFESVGQKLLLASYAKLKLLSDQVD